MKAFGLFHVARYITRDGLRIICYHGFSVGEEYKFRGRLFITKEFFRRRVDYLQHQQYPILRLGEAMQALDTGRLPPCATVITMDDGWRGVYSEALPVIRELSIPATVYVNTYYIEHPMPVYTVALAYLFWLTKEHYVDLPRGLGSFELDYQAERAETLALEFGMTLPPADRSLFLKEVAKALGIDFAKIERKQQFQVLNEQQLRELDDAGVDIQLHTHRHQWSLDDREKVETEIVENREYLERVLSHPLQHFCYPSGIYALHQGEWLAALGITSATTIDPGLNYADTSRFALRRLVDGHPVSDIEFEAEMTGLMEIIRAFREGRLWSMLQRRFRRRGEHVEQGAPETTGLHT